MFVSKQLVAIEGSSQIKKAEIKTHTSKQNSARFPAIIFSAVDLHVSFDDYVIIIISAEKQPLLV